MTYSAKTWVADDVIGHADLNNIETGVLAAYRAAVGLRQVVRSGPVDSAGAAACLGVAAYTAAIPQMTGDSAPSGAMVYSAEYAAGSNEAYRACDRNASTQWAPSAAGTTGTIGYDWGSSKIFGRYDITAYSLDATTAPKDWTFEGWNGSAWVTLDTQTGQTFTGGQTRSFYFVNTTGYTKGRLNVTANNGGAVLYVVELQMYTWAGATSQTGVDLLGGTTTVESSIAAGMSGALPVDYTVQVSTNATNTWTSLTASSTCYLYQDYAAGVVTYSFSTLRPVYAPVAPSAPATDQHWFDLTTWTMKRWSGAAWVAVTRVFFGEVTTTTGGIVTACSAYTYNGLFLPGRLSASASTSYALSHNLGTDKVVAQVHEATSAGGSLRPVALTGLTSTTYSLTTGSGVVEINPIIRRAF